MLISGINLRGGTYYGAIPVRPTVIGEAWGGGYYAGKISTTGDGVATHYLIVAPNSSGLGYDQWRTSNADSPGTDSDIDGPTNTANMDNANHPAAKFCAALTIGGYSDWYMPAKNELEVCYYNLKPGTNLNDPSGANPNSVPPHGTYSSGTPAQTSATDFKSGTGAQAFIQSYYWASTQASTIQAWQQAFNTGFQFAPGKANTAYVRAVRRIPV